MSLPSLHAALRARFERDPSRPFLRVPGGRTWSYGEVDAKAGRIGGALIAAGVRPGDRVMAQVAKSTEAVALYLAAVRVGAVYVPLNTAYTAAEIEFFAGDARPRVFVAESSDLAGALPADATLLTLRPDGSGTLADAARAAGARADPSPRAGGDVAAMLYTSGTTGRSKGAMLTSDNLVSNAQALHRIWGWRDDDVLLHVLPIFHVHGLFVALHCAMLGGSEVVFVDRFDPTSVGAHLPDSTVMMGVPTYYHRMLADPDFGAEHCRSMRLFTSGSAPLSETAHRAFEARTGHVILERYGMTEAGMITSNPLDGARIAGTVGYPLPDVEIRVVDDQGVPVAAGTPGTVEVKGPNVFAGYWQLPDKTAAEFREDGFFRTGDIGTLSDDGRLTLAGRSSDMIISGGLNVYPKEVELCLDEVEGVAESAVIGVPHPDFGEAVVAFVVRSGEVDETGLRAAAETSLANFKRPRRYLFVEELPRNAMGKVQKAALRTRPDALLE